MIDQLLEQISLAVAKEAGGAGKENFQFPGKFGDISCNIAFSLAKKKGKSPAAIAEELAGKIEDKLPSYIEKAEAKGGYINFYLDYQQLFEAMLKEKEISPTGRKILVEFSNPNPCKAMHIGHARTTFLGDSVSEILRFCGNEVTRANYYNDLGKQLAKAIFAVQKYGLHGKKKLDHQLAEVYVKLHKDLPNNPDWEKEIQEILNQLEKKDPKLDEIRSFVLEGVTQGFSQTYRKLGVKFDTYFYESEFREKGKEITKEIEKKGFAFYSDEGTLVASLERAGLPNTVLLRSDGTGLYITSDLALTVHRFEKYKLNECIWVVGNDQNLYFQQLFKLFELMNYPFAKNCRHMSYGMVTLQGSKMSSRAGEFILLDEMIDEIVEKAKEEVKERHPDVDKSELDGLAEGIGIGALKYDILKVDRNRNVDFNPAKAVRFEGNTGPYIQYMAVRCRSILKKAPAKSQLEHKNGDKCQDVDLAEYKPTEWEKSLMRKSMEFGLVCKRAGEELKPNLVCNFAFELATIFSQFYENCKVIGSPEEAQRLLLVQKTKEILEKCLELLRIEVPERM